MKTSYPNLEEFFGTYFHQDWREDAPTAVGIVQRYLAEWPPEAIRKAARELQCLLIENGTEGELEGQMRIFGSFYSPKADGLSYGKWLRQVLQLLMARVDE